MGKTVVHVIHDSQDSVLNFNLTIIQSSKFESSLQPLNRHCRVHSELKIPSVCYSGGCTIVSLDFRGKMTNDYNLTKSPL
jgi:hypothetical protein